jgi:uncharacterized protein (TIGR02147 family)
MIYEHKDYRSFLKKTLAEKVMRNPAFSLRSMSRQVGLSPSLMSDVIQGKKRLSLDSGTKISSWLKLKPREKEYLSSLIQLEQAKSEELKVSILEKLDQLNPSKNQFNLDVETFKVIADWYHIPIMEMTNIAGFEFTAQNIAKLLGISKAEVDVAIDRLERMKLIEKTDIKTYKKCSESFLIGSDTPNIALRSFHRQMLEKAILSLAEQKPDEKFVGSETFAFDPQTLKEAADILEDCFQKIIRLSKKSKNRKNVYHLGIQLFNLTKKDRS